MHTFIYGPLSDRIFIHHNSDMSGKVKIVSEGKEVEIPGAAILELVALFVRDQKIAKLEGMEDHEILGVDKWLA